MDTPVLDDERPRDDEIISQHYAIQAEEAQKLPFVGDKVSLRSSSYPLISRLPICSYDLMFAALALLSLSLKLSMLSVQQVAFSCAVEDLNLLSAEYEFGNPVFKTKIEKLAEVYSAIRRTRGDGNCFFRAFIFSYLEHIQETKNEAEVTRVLKNVEKCKQTLLSFGHAEFTFEDFFASFLELLEAVLPGHITSLSLDGLVERCRESDASNYVVMFCRFVTSGEIRRRADFFEPFIMGMSNTNVEQFCKASVEPMGEESDHVHIIALSDALGVPIRVVYLDRSLGEGGKSAEVNYHDFIPSDFSDNDQGKVKPSVILLYRPGHYDILYPK